MRDDGDKVVELRAISRDKLDNILSRRQRIRRRLRNVPQYYQAELRRRHPDRIDLFDGFFLRVRRGRWRILDHGYREERFPRVRTIHAWLMKGRVRVGAIEIDEIDGELVGDWAFWEAMDAESSTFTELAEALLSCWPSLDHKITGYGWVFHLDHVWLARVKGAPAACLKGIEALVTAVQDDTAIIVTRLFPTEYGGRVPDDQAPSNVGLRRRLRAMERVASRALKLQRLPRPHDDDAVFYWRPLRAAYFSPVYHENWRKSYEAEPESSSANDP